MKNKNNINRIYNISKNFAEFSSNYFDYLKKVFQNIDSNSINKIENDFNQLRLRKKTIFVIGNGGAAATAITMANDLGFDILKKTNTKKTFKISSLNDNNSVITAIANDTGYENIFINQLKIHYQKGDALVILSASGNSPNLLTAIEVAKLAKDFADKGQTAEAMDIPSNQWVEVIGKLEDK